jgi:hypothetical protein
MNKNYKCDFKINDLNLKNMIYYIFKNIKDIIFDIVAPFAF